MRQGMSESEAGRMGAWATHMAGKTTTTAARAAMEEKFRRQVDPDGVLDEAEVAKRVAHAKSLHYSRIARMRRK